MKVSNNFKTLECLSISKLASNLSKQNAYYEDLSILHYWLDFTVRSLSSLLHKVAELLWKRNGSSSRAFFCFHKHGSRSGAVFFL